MDGDREHWERFVLVKVDAHEGMSMYPRLLPGATVLIDRHYNSLKPYRKGESNMYAIARNGVCTVKYVERAGNHLVLRPHNQTYPVEVMPMEAGKSPSRLPRRPHLPRRDRDVETLPTAAFFAITDVKKAFDRRDR